MVTVAGDGELRAIALLDTGFAAVVDLGDEQPGRLLLFDQRDEVALDAALDVAGVAHHRPGGIAGAGDAVVVTTAEPAAVLTVDREGRAAVLAVIPDLPACRPLAPVAGCQPGLLDRQPAPGHASIADDGTVHVVDRAQGCIFTVGEGDTEATPWWCDSSLQSGPATPATPGAGGVVGIALDDDRVVVSVPAARPDAADVLVEIPIEADGSAGEAVRLAEAPSDSGIAGLTLLEDGRVVASLSGLDGLLVVAGTDDARVVELPDVFAPHDVEHQGDSVLVAHRGGGGAGRVTEVPAGRLGG